MTLKSLKYGRFTSDFPKTPVYIRIYSGGFVALQLEDWLDLLNHQRAT